MANKGADILCNQGGMADEQREEGQASDAVLAGYY